MKTFKEMRQLGEGKYSPKTLKFLSKMAADLRKYEKQYESNKEIKYGKFGSFENKVYQALSNARRHIEDLFEE